MVAEAVKAITDAFTGLLTGIGTGIVDFFDVMVMNSEGTGLSNFALWAFIFLGVGLALFIVRKITSKVS